MNKLEKYFIESYRDFHGEGFSAKGASVDKSYFLELEAKYINGNNYRFEDKIEIVLRCMNTPGRG